MIDTLGSRFATPTMPRNDRKNGQPDARPQSNPEIEAVTVTGATREAWKSKQQPQGELSDTRVPRRHDLPKRSSAE